MKLIYYQRNKNFGDALNPMIFNKFLPDFFDEDPSTVLLGIGSIIQFKIPEAKKTLVFSSGYAYGKVPKVDDSYDVLCVRGPLTAEKLGLDNKLAITDGAALLKVFDWPKEEKQFKCSFMPHHESPYFFDWKKACEEVGFNYIDPLDDSMTVISQILQSEVLITEAMHGAIVADTLRVPWVPVKIYPTISEFKWRDWTSSLDISYEPILINPLYDKVAIKKKIAVKFNHKAPNSILNTASGIYKTFQDYFINKNTLRKFSQLQFSRSYLSKEHLLDSRVVQLLTKISLLKKQYANSQKQY